MQAEAQAPTSRGHGHDPFSIVRLDQGMFLRLPDDWQPRMWTEAQRECTRLGYRIAPIDAYWRRDGGHVFYRLDLT